jgi:transcription elongation factor Elf1
MYYHLGAGIKNMESRLPFTCPICGRKKDYAVTELVEGAILTCPFCRLTLTLHGHMWEDIQREIRKIKGEDGKAVMP